REIVEEAKAERPLDSSLASACLYTKHSQELLEYAIGTCPKDLKTQDNQHASTTLIRKKRVTFVEPCETSTHNTQAHVEQQKIKKINEPGIPSTRVKGATTASGSKPRSNTTTDRTLPAKSYMKKVEAHPRNNKSNAKQKNRVDSSISYKRTVKQTWNPTGKVFTTVGHHWKPTGRIFPLGGQCPLVRPTTLNSGIMLADPQEINTPVIQIVLWTVRFENDHFGAIIGYGDSVLGHSVISRKHTCFVRDLDGVNFLKGSRGTNLYTISVEDMMRSSPICLMSKASKNKSWLWHRHLNHLNFGTINDLTRKDVVRGLPRLKFEKDHLCFACQLGKSRKATHKPKMINTVMEVLHTLHMDLCRPLRVQSINGKKYILVIIDDYSRFTWVKFLRSKDETSKFVIKLLKPLQIGLNKTVRNVRTDNGT
ncbi:retrovirus-related pol polyprotein from transposon TNT 1-94, partial [Tanacetum coccineum]